MNGRSTPLHLADGTHTRDKIDLFPASSVVIRNARAWFNATARIHRGGWRDGGMDLRKTMRACNRECMPLRLEIIHCEPDGYLTAPGLNRSDKSVAIAAPPNHG
jgi:hypothetical protein